MPINKNEAIRIFIANTSLNGAGWINVAVTRWLKLFWVVVIVIGFTGLSIHTSLLIEQYISNPVQVQISLTQKASLKFPAVTVCNLNPVKASFVKCTSKRSVMLLESESSRPVRKYLRKRHLPPLADQYDPLKINVTFCNLQKRDLLKKFSDKPTIRKLIKKIYAKGRRKLLAEIKRFEEYKNIVSYNNTLDYDRSYYDYDDNLTSSEYHDYDYNLTSSEYPGQDDCWNKNDTNNYCDDTTEMASGDYPDYDYSPEQMSPEVQNLLDKIGSSNKEGFNSMDSSSSVKKLLSSSKLSDLHDILYLMDMPEDLMAILGTEREDFIVECSFNLIDCLNQQYFMEFIHEKYGKCFTFNSGLANQTSHWITQEDGSGSGLRMTLNIQSGEYLGLFSSEYGVKVSVSENEKVAFPEMDGIIATPGLKTSIGLQYKNTEYLKSPYSSNCSEHYPSYLMDWAYNFEYSMTLCNVFCNNHFLYKRCGCVELTESRYNFEQLDDEQPLKRCDVFNATDRKCKTDLFFKSSADNELPCKQDCTVECSSVNFEATVSTSVWPTVMYERLKVNNFLGKDKVSQLMFEDLVNTENVELQDEDFLAVKDLVRIQIYYQQLNIQRIQEQPAYELITLIADIGGIMGLYMGIANTCI